jgi:integrase
MRRPLGDLTADRVEAWLEKEVKDRPTQARLAYRLLKAFLNWCADHKQFKTIIGPGILTRRVTECLPKKQAKVDCLQKEQLAAWFAGVRQACTPTIAAYLQCLLLTGARRRELASLKWSQIDFRWKSITIHDKVEGERIIPLTPYLENLLRWMPNKGEYVFASTGESGFLQAPTRAHARACKIAGIEGLTLHGLRRSFGSLSEWVEIPAGVAAQLMGHKPSATAEKHYRVRPLDLLRQWHIKLEAWILEQAGIPIPATEQEKQPLRLVAGEVMR